MAFQPPPHDHTTTTITITNRIRVALRWSLAEITKKITYTHAPQAALTSFTAAITMVQPHPSILVVPGAWHQPAAYSKLVTSLRTSAYPTNVTTLPSCNSPDPQTATCSADADAVRQEILLSIDAGGKDLVVVCHSYGGIPGGGAAYGLSKTARAEEGKEGGVVGLIYVAGFVVPEGSSLLETLGGRHAPYVDPDQVFTHRYESA